MSAAHRSFGVDGIRVDVEAGSPELIAAVDALLGAYLATTEPAAPRSSQPIKVRLDVGGPGPPVPTTAPRFAFPPLRAYDAPDGFLMIDDVGHLDVVAAAGQIHGVVPVGSDAFACWRFVALGVWLALLECFRVRGRYMIHAAAVIDPSGELILLAGARGAGKTTAALTLVEAGWRTLGDDTVFVQRNGGSLEVIGHPRPFHVSDEVLAHRPHLRRHARRPPEFDPQDKQFLAIEAAFPGCLVRRWHGPPRLYFPEVTARPISSATPLSPRQALTRLFRHSVFVFARPELAPDHLSVLGSLVDSAPATLLACGRDVFLNPARFEGLIQETGCQSVASA